MYYNRYTFVITLSYYFIMFAALRLTRNNKKPDYFAKPKNIIKAIIPKRAEMIIETGIRISFRKCNIV